MPFSGVVFVKKLNGENYEQGHGYANRSDNIKNTTSTRFGIASGCKIFTAVAIMQLVDQKKLDLDTLLSDCLDVPFPAFDSGIAIRHLLTHSSGIPDYFDEEVMSDFAELWDSLPMYTMTSASAFLPMFQYRGMKFKPGERFSYSNAGFIVLGLIVEQVSGLTFQEYVQTHIFERCGMKDSGYFRLDQLPERTASGYIEQGTTWSSNLYSIPVIGGPDGGAFTTVYDWEKFWDALLGCQLLSPSSTGSLLSPQIQVNKEIHYGYGVWMRIQNNEIDKFYVMGNDPGVDMRSIVYPRLNTRIHILSNNGKGAGAIADALEEQLFEE
ncbi:serine hydrolase [Paenibacillus albidus]|uniref:serine hydrolase domain-containing protein n=1 Tax=Paenibacillus albidus TaxID=2041023 RepID=UPI001BEAF6C2|nr:serine hydrolase [Paenibacillus albidus]MBT2293598.1 serine hydrolase [Paenibacillus albidus]